MQNIGNISDMGMRWFSLRTPKSWFAPDISKQALLKKVNDLEADYAMVMDQCQAMKEHVAELEQKISSFDQNAKPLVEVEENEAPYSLAILLAKRGHDKQDLVKMCNLTENEADLIISLHNRAVENEQANIAVR